MNILSTYNALLEVTLELKEFSLSEANQKEVLKSFNDKNNGNTDDYTLFNAPSVEFAHQLISNELISKINDVYLDKMEEEEDLDLSYPDEKFRYDAIKYVGRHLDEDSIDLLNITRISFYKHILNKFEFVEEA